MSKNKLGIIVPYRDRYWQLQIFIDWIEKYFKKSSLDYTVIIVEQDNASAFNRGMLCNIGFLEAEKRKCDYVVFHDVDMLPISVNYSYSNVPVHLATDNLPFPSYFGGITLFPSDVFKSINGFSNLYWGWGFEDDDLRYRCIKNQIPFESCTIPKESEEITLIYNGIDAYSNIPNVINYNRNFTIEIIFQLDRPVFNHKTPSDSFPILNIKGNDFRLSYSSFNRFHLQVFDSEGRYYDLFSNIITSNFNTVRIQYLKDDQSIILYVNNKLEGRIQIENKLYRYSKSHPIRLGSDHELSSFFKGSINSFSVESNQIKILHYENQGQEKYILEDLSGNNHHGELINVYFGCFKEPLNYYSFIPFRRESQIKFLKHASNGFHRGRWKSDLTRWNQLRYNNEVQNGGHDSLEDGLSTCLYTEHGKTVNDKVVHLNIGI